MDLLYCKSYNTRMYTCSSLVLGITPTGFKEIHIINKSGHAWFLATNPFTTKIIQSGASGHQLNQMCRQCFCLILILTRSDKLQIFYISYVIWPMLWFLRLKLTGCDQRENWDIHYELHWCKTSSLIVLVNSNLAIEKQEENIIYSTELKWT